MSFLSLDDLKVWADITNPDDFDSLQMALDQSEGIFMTYLNSPIKKPDTPIVEDIYLPRETNSLMPKYRPIISIESIKYGYDQTIEFQEEEYAVLRDMTIVNDGSVFARGRYEVSYYAGYDPIPDDLIYGIFSQALWVWQRGDSSTIYQTKALIPENLKELMRQYGALI